MDLSGLDVVIAEAEREGWLGEVEGLQVSLAGAENKLAQLDAEASRNRVIHLGMPEFCEIAGRTVEHSSAHPTDLISDGALSLAPGRMTAHER
ncbi:hypothetical protein AB0B12_39965 [Streptomyces sp. NPDC044780]|uniref:hypothetical protein n=1 Tax=unclassified Streptomyces TaxID=2593676 RepID=UPI0033F1D07A